MESIYGNDTLISVALNASSPTQAAKKAQLMGCSREQIRAIRNAAKLLKEEGREEFDKKFTPYKVVKVSVQKCDTMNIKLKLNKPWEQRPLNSEEFNKVAEIIEKELAKLGIETTIKRKKSHPYVKSTL